MFYEAAAPYKISGTKVGNMVQTHGAAAAQVNQSNNRITGPMYDNVGNVVQDMRGYTHTYDAESRLTSVATPGSLGGETTYYQYDENGQRVVRSYNTATTDNGSTGNSGNGSSTLEGMEYVYDISGRHIADFDPTTAHVELSEVYAGGRHLATYAQDGNTYFIHSDWLGTERARTKYDGTVYEYCSSNPFGDNLQCSGTQGGPPMNLDASAMHFTGKERDTESGNDYFGARYFGSSVGRFLSPDPLQTLKLTNPQTLNRYAYTVNNPLRSVDPDGNCTAPAVAPGQVGICVESYIRSMLLPGLKGKLAFGDNRGPNPDGGTFRTQTLISVDPNTHQVNLQSATPGRSCTVFGCLTGVNNSHLSRTTTDDKGDTYFTLTVYGESGYEKQGVLGAPKGWIEMEFSFEITPEGKVKVDDAATKQYPSASVYSYDSSGNSTNIWQQAESGNINDLEGPMSSAPSGNQDNINSASQLCQSGDSVSCDKSR